MEQEKVDLTMNNILTIEKSIKNAIDDAVDNLGGKATITEVYSALINVLKKFNSEDITNLVSSRLKEGK